MAWMKLVILAVALCNSIADKTAESHLVYALERKGLLVFYMTDLNLQNPKEIFQLKKSPEIDKMYLSNARHGLIVYWSQKDSSVIGRYAVTTKKKQRKRLRSENATFLGLGDNEKIYLYSPNSKSLSVYEYESAKKLLEMKGLKNSDTDMHCVDVDPRDREQIYFAECFKNTYTARVYDISENAILKDYEQALPTCFDTWRITPDGQRVYAVIDKCIYVSPKVGAPFTESYTAADDIVGFAVGNNEVFYSNKVNAERSKIFKAVPQGNGYSINEIDVEGIVKFMASYTPPKRQFLIYATENKDDLEFVKTDLDFRKFKTLLKINTNGQEFDKMQLGYNEDGEAILYWSYKCNSSLRRVEITTSKEEQRHLNQKLGTFLGAGNNDKTYFYNSDERTFTVYDFKSKEEELLVDVLPEDVDMHCVDVDPRNRALIFFVECTKTGKSFAKVLDVNEKKVLKDSEDLPSCFDSWRITPNGEKTFALHEEFIYVRSKEGDLFDLYDWIPESVQAFAVGNKELFYTTKETDGKRIFKFIQGRGGYNAAKFDSETTVKALVLYQE